MSTARRLKKIKPADPAQQHNIRKFIADCTKLGLLPVRGKATQVKTVKKQRQSTGDKNQSSKRKQDLSTTPESEAPKTSNQAGNLAESQNIDRITNSMSTVSVSPQMGTPVKC